MDHIICIMNIYREHGRAEFADMSKKAKKSREWEQQFEKFCNDPVCQALWYHADNKEEQKRNLEQLTSIVHKKYPLLIS